MKQIMSKKHIHRAVLILSLFLFNFLLFVPLNAQPRFSQPHGLYDVASLTVSIEGNDASAEIHYTTDGSTPTPSSMLYTTPLVFNATTLLRAVEVKDGAVVSPVATATYLFLNSLLSQPNNPEGYPSQWGQYTQISGWATADYEMDPEMTNDPVLRQQIIAGFRHLPMLSIVTDRDNLFSHENDSVRGGIYIFTGPPVGDNTGHGWTRPASVELFSPQGGDNTLHGNPEGFSTGCGLRLHGGHGRLAEKNPKHSFRLVFKEQYGAKSLKYPIFGTDQPQKFDQLVLRCHFGNTWQHWAEGNREKAQYTRDVWARCMQHRMGRTSVNALYVNLFLNGMYWGMYNIAERVDDQFGKDHIGGNKKDIDVIKIEEDGGNHIEASEGTLDAWHQMVQAARVVGGYPANITPDEAYQALQDSLLDIDAFIDYMLINQYGGNTDWDHHNWYALRRRGQDSEGFRFLCWDTEIIFENERENVLSKNNGNEFPTGIFQNLLHNDDFARRYVRRAKEVFSEDGILGHASVVELWDSLYNTIRPALYCEAARWGDYRRDVHRWQSAGRLYTVDETYMAERQRLLTNYFPVRTQNVLNYILAYVDIDDFVMPDGWQPLASSMFMEWTNGDADAQPTGHQVQVSWNFNQEANSGTAVAGFVNVENNLFADLSNYEYLVLRGTGNGLRILANRIISHGEWKQIVVNFNQSDPYWNDELGAIVIPFDDLKTMNTTSGNYRPDSFLHLHVLKVDWNKSCNVRAAYLIPNASLQGIDLAHRNVNHDGHYYDLQGRRVSNPRHGIFIKDGRRVIIK